jgi:hypothetical protein
MICWFFFCGVSFTQCTQMFDSTDNGMVTETVGVDKRTKSRISWFLVLMFSLWWSTKTLCNAYIHDSLHWRATMNSFRLATVKKHDAYLPTFVPALSATTFRLGPNFVFFSRTGFVYIKNWKNSENSSISQLCFLFVIYLRFIITLVKISLLAFFIVYVHHFIYIWVIY